MNGWERLRQALGNVLFWLAFALCCVLLVPVCLLLVAASGLFTAAEWCSRRLAGSGMKDQ